MSSSPSYINSVRITRLIEKSTGSSSEQPNYRLNSLNASNTNLLPRIQSSNKSPGSFTSSRNQISMSETLLLKEQFEKMKNLSLSRVRGRNRFIDEALADSSMSIGSFSSSTPMVRFSLDCDFEPARELEARLTNDNQTLPVDDVDVNDLFTDIADRFNDEFDSMGKFNW